MPKIGGELVWAEERNIVSQTALNGARKGAKMEQERINQGWRWVQVGKITKVLVPCDENGDPTEDGLQRIERVKRNLISV